MDTVIQTNGLTRHFGANVALDALSLDIRRGEVFGFLGHNGAGKTTTVRLLNGILAPTAGQARVLGLDPSTHGAALRRRTGVLTETPALDERLTATENLRTYGDLFGLDAQTAASRAAALLERFHLTDRGNERVSGFSKGMKQRLALCRALLHQPELLFLDEPTSGLDPVSIREVHELVRQAAREQGVTVFLCTHNLVEAQQLCDRVAVLERGRVMASGTPRELSDELGTGHRVRIEVEPTLHERALQILHSAGVEATQANGSPNPGLILRCPSRNEVPQSLRLLIQAGIEVYAVVPLEASLEDVYFALHADGEKAV